MKKNTEIKFTFPSMFLTTCFIVMRIFGIINWEWYWLIAPIWIPILLIMVFVIIIIFALIIAKILE